MISRLDYQILPSGNCDRKLSQSSFCLPSISHVE